MTTALAEQTTGFSIRPDGPFSLEEAAMFGFGQRHQTTFDGTMRLAFCVDGFAAQAAVSVTQSADGTVHGLLCGTSGDVDPSAVFGQVARVLSIDHDATTFVTLGDADPVLSRLLGAAPGLRPPLFYSPYEAALWAALSARRPRRTAEGWRDRLSAVAGTRFEVAGVELSVPPTPDRVVSLGIDGIRGATGIELRRAEAVMAVAEAARAGLLDATRLAALDPETARTRLRTIRGIGPFYADLIYLRATGVTDALPAGEPRLLSLVGELWSLGEPASPAQLEHMAQGWVPWRTWVAVLIRAAGPRALGRQ